MTTTGWNSCFYLMRRLCVCFHHALRRPYSLRETYDSLYFKLQFVSSMWHSYLCILREIFFFFFLRFLSTNAHKSAILIFALYKPCCVDNINYIHLRPFKAKCKSIARWY
eukprot:76036_1